MEEIICKYFLNYWQLVVEVPNSTIGSKVQLHFYQTRADSCDLRKKKKKEKVKCNKYLFFRVISAHSSISIFV